MLRIALLLFVSSLSSVAFGQAVLSNQNQPSGGDLPAASFKRAVLSFGLMGQFAENATEFTALTVRNSASQPVSATDIVTVQLWLDDGDDIFVNGADKLIASKSTGDFPCVLTDFASTQAVIEGHIKRYFISIDVSSSASANKNLKLKLDASDIQLVTGVATLDGSAVEGELFKIVNNAVPVLVIITQPDGAIEGQALSTQPVVELRDAAGNKLNNSITEVTVSVTAGSGKGSINPPSKITVTTVSGVATFSDLLIDRPGGSYQLTFTAANFASVTSDKFKIDSISPPPAAIADNNKESDTGFFGCTANNNSSTWLIFVGFIVLLQVWRRRYSKA